MSNIQELEAKYIELGKEIEKLKAEQPKEFPQIGDEYWFVDTVVCDTDYYKFENDATDQCLQKIGNFFQFKEQALAELETLKVIAELKKCKGVKKFVQYEDNFSIGADNAGFEVSFWYDSPSGLFNIYFDSEESAQEAINKVGEQRIINAVKWQAEGDYSCECGS